MKSLEIRPYKTSEFEEVFQVYQLSRAGETCFADAEISRKKFSHLIRGEQIYVSVIEERIVGFISIWPAEKFIHHFYVLPEHQGKGIANKLMAHLISIFDLPLSLKSLAENKKACAYYEHMGWLNEEVGGGPDGLYHHYWLRA